MYIYIYIYTYREREREGEHKYNRNTATNMECNRSLGYVSVAEETTQTHNQHTIR